MWSTSPLAFGLHFFLVLLQPFGLATTIVPSNFFRELVVQAIGAARIITSCHWSPSPLPHIRFSMVMHVPSLKLLVPSLFVPALHAHVLVSPIQSLRIWMGNLLTKDPLSPTHWIEKSRCTWKVRMTSNTNENKSHRNPNSIVELSWGHQNLDLSMHSQALDPLIETRISPDEYEYMLGNMNYRRSPPTRREGRQPPPP